jgi:asparagine N-glycosylation enzyme membrane subunit Stt3
MSKKHKHNRKLEMKSPTVTTVNQNEETKKQDGFKYFWLIISVIVFAGFLLRFIPWANVMTDNVVQLKGADAYYFVREAENIKNGGIPTLDKMFCAPNGLITEKNSLLYSQILAYVSTIVDLELVTAWSGPVFAMLTVICIVFILKELFPRNYLANITGTAIASFTGLQFIARSYYGFGDRHVVETFFTTFSLFALLRTINTKSWKWSVVTAIGFILYTLSWSEAPTLILFIGAGVIINGFINKSIKEIWKQFLLINIIQAGAALLIPNNYLLMVSVGLIISTLLVYLILEKIEKRRIQLLIISVSLLSIILFIYFVLPQIFTKTYTTVIRFLFPDAVSSTISEFQPMFGIYKTWYNPFGKAGAQVLIHLITAIGFYYMAKKKHYHLIFLGIAILTISLAKIRGEYYLLIINAISFVYIADRFKKFGYYGIALAIYFTVLYWGGEIQANNNVSLIFSNNDYKMAEWMKNSLPNSGIADSGTYQDNKNPQYWVIGRWDIGYLYGYLAKKPMFAAPNLCNYLVPTEFLSINNEQTAYDYAKARNIKYAIVRYNSLSRFYSEYNKLNLPTPEVIGGQSPNGNVYYFISEEYYQTLNVSLFNFDGKATKPKSIYYFQNREAVETDNLDEARLYGDKGKIYSLDPFSTSIELPELKHFKLLHTEGQGQDAVKLFEIVD